MSHERGVTAKSFGLRFWLRRSNVSCTWAFLAFSDFKLDFLALIQRSIALYVDFRMVNEQIIAPIVGNNKTVSLLRIEPFHCTRTYGSFSLHQPLFRMAHLFAMAEIGPRTPLLFNMDKYCL